MEFLKMTAFWDIIPLVEVDESFRAAYCLHHHGGTKPLFVLLPPACCLSLKKICGPS
jgi:hypothetical protein